MSKPSSSRHSSGNSFLDKHVTGTTTLVLIGDNAAYVVTDLRTTDGKAPYMIAEDNASKTFPISRNILATTSGDSQLCALLLKRVKAIVDEVDPASTNLVDDAANIARQLITDWEQRRSEPCPAGTIIVGWYDGLPCAYDLRVDPPKRTQDHGDGFVQGSGENSVERYYKEMENPNDGTTRKSDDELVKIGKRAAVYAALNDPYAGGGVRWSEVRSDMILHLSFEENLKVLHDNYDKFKTYLSRFLFCLYRKSEFEYAADTETKLSELIQNRFKSETQRSHVFQIKDKYFIRILQFKDEKVAQEEYQGIERDWKKQSGCTHTDDLDVHRFVRALPWIMLPKLDGTPLVFAMPTKKNISLFLDL